ncbi:RluA family pseudouridine synthase [Brevibacillus daliensis]|uniref:RluA family pseudouridine synthase n=1 Tax=Brevibacillus daliensis TaxID=2892995 RepID=UPI0035A06B3B
MNKRMNNRPKNQPDSMEYTTSKRPPAKANNRQSNKSTNRPNSKKAHEAADKPSTNKQFTVKEPAELLPFLLAHEKKLSRNSIKSLLTRKEVSVNGKIVTAHNYQLHPGQIVTIQKEKQADSAPLVGLKIIHEDEDIIVIKKDAGLLSVASPKEDEMTAYRQLMAHVRNENPQNRIFVVHRLDRDTSGVMMFAKSEKIQQALQNAWKESVQERLYVALVEGEVKKPEGTISSWLKESKTLLMYSSQRPNDGQHAITHYKVLESNRNFSLLEVHLDTGRKNQIRVHMQDIGHPIVGDKKYGAKSKAIGRLGLHARVLSFVHPTTGKAMRFETEIPKTFLRPFQSESFPS